MPEVTLIPGRPLRIVLADEPSACRMYRPFLRAMGHRVVAVARSAADIVQKCREARPDLVIAEVRLKGEPDGVAAAAAVCREREIPFVLLGADPDVALLARAAESHVMAYLLKPLKPSDLGLAVYFAALRFDHYLLAKAEADDLRQTLRNLQAAPWARGGASARARKLPDGREQRLA
jgi:response regulator NasT